ncbi:hypothetical protein [Sphingomonas sp. 8AM]|uniref:hypothetical protein n=1 Tax=Sphingomonas sp. 8AM TaxID=2653170 RepID=UPI0012EEF172|nr:hypothetical protein [Sphingomonas sp. 8AM]VXC61521.1 conserved hypothetical protein [Sphingomonas sp. 8AM]
MTARGLSAWFGLGSSLLAILVSVERPHWFGLAASAPARDATTAAAAPDPRTAPWLIKRDVARAR